MTKTLFWLPIVLAFFCPTAGRADDSLFESLYFPVRVGSKTVFKFPKVEWEWRCVRIENFAGKECGRFETYNAKNRMLSVDHIHVAADGVYRMGFNSNRIEPPLLLLKLPPRKDESWTVDCKLMGERIQGEFKTFAEKVTTATGVFDTIAVKTADLTTTAPNGGKQVVSKCDWYAPKVGCVKQSLTIGTETGAGEAFKIVPGMPASSLRKTPVDATIGTGDYYPIKAGGVATFRFPRSEIELRCVRTEKFADVDCVRFESVEDGRLQSFEHVQVTPTGVYRIGFNGKKIEPPLLLLKLPVAADANWSVRSTLGNETITGDFKVTAEVVQTGMGPLAAVAVRSDNLTTTSADGKRKVVMQSNIWYAPGKGVVKKRFQYLDKASEGEIFRYQPGR